MSVPDNVVAVVAILAIFGLPLLYAIVSRALSYHERIEMIKRGMVPPPDPRLMRKAARYGWSQPGYGAPPTGVQGGYYPGYDPYGYGQYQAYRTLRGGITVALVGLALLIGLSFISPGRLGPYLLGGLIPLFVGIAQIITALLSGARLGSWGLGPTMPGPGPSAQPGAAPGHEEPPHFGAASQDIPSGPYGWRPGPAPELKRPVPPPDVKQ